MVGAALWRVKGDQPIHLSLFKTPSFYRVLALAMGLHMIWNFGGDPYFYVKALTLGAVAWFVIWGLVQQGLRQVLDEQRATQNVDLPTGTLPRS